MSQVGNLAVNLLYRILTDGSIGVAAQMEKLTSTGEPDGRCSAATVLVGNVGIEAVEKTGGALYPAAHVSCSKIVNSAKEKFRTFSGTVELLVDVRVSDDDPAKLATALHEQVSAITTVLEYVRGRWADGVYFTGVYEVTFGSGKRGGKNFVQSARVQLPVNISM